MRGDFITRPKTIHTFASKSLGMDSLTYKYKLGTNQLDHVNDVIPVGNYTIDVDNQSAGNYAYDSIGSLVRDNAVSDVVDKAKAAASEFARELINTVPVPTHR